MAADHHPAGNAGTAPSEDDDLRDIARSKLRQMRDVMHYVERYETADPHPVVPMVMDRINAGPRGRHVLPINNAMDASELSEWSSAEVICEASERHPLKATDLVNLVISTGSPIWTYSLRQMRRLFDMLDPTMENYISEAALEKALETDMQIQDFVKSLENRTITDLLSPPFETTKVAFRVIDTGQTGYIRCVIDDDG